MNDKRKPDSPVKFDFDFNEALERVAQTDPIEAAQVAAAGMNDGAIERLIAAFEDTARSTDEGNEYWTGRDLARLLEYAEYRNFLTIVEKARAACEATGVPPGDHFVDVTDMVEIGSGARREIENLHLSRYACYLTAQNADSRKRAVAFAQTYFAIQTRRQELADQQIAVPMSEDEKRVFLRNQIREHNRHLSSAAKEAGVVSPQDFAIFHSSGYQGLYGRTVGQIRQYKGLTSSVDILDRMGSTELAANFFRVTQTEEKLRKDNTRGKQRAYDTHYAVGRQVRDAMLKISGIAPEDLPAADSIKLAERRLRDACPPPIVKQRTKALPAPAPALDLKPINLRTDLWKYALLVMVQRPKMEISTTDLIAELPTYIQVPEWTKVENLSRPDSKFSQIVRNLKSHKTAGTNFIFQGYAEDIPGGFRATAKGLAFVKEYFRN